MVVWVIDLSNFEFVCDLFFYDLLFFICYFEFPSKLIFTPP